MEPIRVLDKTVSELIAAGEVVERPSSIVKELLENSIDAGATAVTVEIRGGGVRSIRVTDNGCGIPAGEIPTAFLRHATSKIQLSDDLNFISTLGFRGEALPSIAAVSKVEMSSKPSNSPLGYRVCLEGGELILEEEAGCPDGTTIFVRDLFYNVPARLKFLKQDRTEANGVASVLDKLALSHPEISFKLVSDGKVRLHTPGNGELLAAIHAVFGKEFAAAMRKVEYRYQGVSVEGYTSSTESGRSTRSMQHFFVNSRYIRSKLCLGALEEGYKNSLMVGKCPFCVLNLRLPYEAVDVNVHPAKIEVRFSRERDVFDGIYFAVKSALAKEDLLKKAEELPKKPQKNLLSPFHSGKSEKIEQVSIPVPKDSSPAVKLPLHSERMTLHQPKAAYQFQPNQAPSPIQVPKEDSFQFVDLSRLSEPEIPKNLLEEKKIVFIPEEKDDPVSEPVLTGASEKKGEEPSLEKQGLPVRVIGELFQTYVLFEGDQQFFLLDKHAAHERILFEKLKKSVTTEERQVLLTPILVSVSSEEEDVLLANKELILQLGFYFEEFGNHTLLLREVPLVLAEYDLTDIFLDLAKKLLEQKREISSDSLEHLLHSMACRSAIKANDKSDIAELTELLRQVYADDEIRHCPHGRPVVVAFTKAELEKKFGRIP